MILIGIDDTDIIGSPGTNQIARKIARALEPELHCELIIRHQLLDDPRVPYTSQNGSASLSFQENTPVELSTVIDGARRVLLDCYIEGSDPGLCVVRRELDKIPPHVIVFGMRCQQSVVELQDAINIAAAAEIFLEGLGGTNGGMIGALAAIGLVATGDDGRVVHLGDWQNEISGLQSVADIQKWKVAVRDYESGAIIESGMVDVGKKLRPNRRDHQTVLFVQRKDSVAANACEPYYQAIKLR